MLHLSFRPDSKDAGRETERGGGYDTGNPEGDQRPLHACTNKGGRG